MGPKFFDPRQIHRENHRRWGTPSAWYAEWWYNIVQYCKTPEGKKHFEQWIHRRYKGDAPEKLRACNAPPKRVLPGTTSTGNIVMFFKAAYDLGVAGDALVEYNIFMSQEKVACPESTLPAPVRRRGETSTEWVNRRSEANLMGAKFGNMNLREMRRVAYSQFDSIRDQMEAWRTQPDFFLEGLLERAESTILSPGVAAGLEFQTRCGNAFQSRLHIAHLQYAAWSKASDVFEYFDKMGWTHQSQIITAFQKDMDLLGRIVAMFLSILELGRWWSGKMEQVLTGSKRLRPYFVRKRTESGRPIIRVDEDYSRAHPPQDKTIELFLVDAIRRGFDSMPTLSMIRSLSPYLQRQTEAAKLSAECFATLSEWAITGEFIHEFDFSTFGQALRVAVEQAIASGVSDTWYPLLSAIPGKNMLWRVPPDPPSDRFEKLDNIVKNEADCWLSSVFSVNAGPAVEQLLATRMFTLSYDMMWMTADAILWTAAESLAGKDGRPALARRFGLLPPEIGPTRPIYSTEIFFDVAEQNEQVTEQFQDSGTSGQPYVSSFPMATPQDSIAKAPERIQAGEQPKKKKTRAQSRKKHVSVVRPAALAPDLDAEEAAAEAEWAQNFPEFLPEKFELNRRNTEIFHRLLGSEGKRVGQLRWGDFEKAMKQVGFDVCQTEGSSVRFDPPAKAPRAITFHRPHPDSTLSPIMSKWIGARLKRAYGWTAETFKRGPDVEE